MKSKASIIKNEIKIIVSSGEWCAEMANGNNKVVCSELKARAYRRGFKLSRRKRGCHVGVAAK
jgi:hypothetical protein